jgi:uncharacterized protein YdhG (YjbR/CyaY superfamily)
MPARTTRSAAVATGRVASTIDEYLAAVPADARSALQTVRDQIRAAAPGAEETISYRIPTFRLQGPLVGFAAFRDHCSFFVMSTTAMDAHRDALSRYDTSKGTVRFAPERPLPASLVKKLVRTRTAENAAAKRR